ALGAFAQFVDLKSPFTVGHSGAVARLVQAAGEQAGLPAADAVALGRSGLLHDLGMVAVPAPVFEKRGPLTTDERERVRVHTYQGERIVARSPALSALGAVASRHHERSDGSGYHRGVDARAISHPARLLAAADAFQSMTEERPYRAAPSPGHAVLTPQQGGHMTAKELFYEAMRRTDSGDQKGFLECFTADVNWLVPGAQLDGIEQVRGWVAPFWQGFPTFRHDIDRAVADSDDTVFAEGTWTGEHNGTL